MPTLLAVVLTALLTMCGTAVYVSSAVTEQVDASWVARGCR